MIGEDVRFIGLSSAGGKGYKLQGNCEEHLEIDRMRAEA